MVTGAVTGRARAADTSPIIIGYPAALTGPSSAPGQGQNRGVGYIVDQINAAGGVKGRKIEMVIRDTQSDPTKAVNAVQEMMANAKVHAIFGPNSSGECLATTPIVARRNIPNIHCSGITQLIDVTKYPNAFRQVPTNDQSSDPPRIYVQKVLKLNKVAVIGDSSGYGTSAVTDSVANFKKNGGEVVYQGTIDATQPDMTPDMLRIKASGAEAVIPWTVSTGMMARLLNARGAMGWDVPFVSRQALGSGEVGQLLAQAGILEERVQQGFKNSHQLPAVVETAGEHAGVRRWRAWQDQPHRHLAVVDRVGSGRDPADRQGGRHHRRVHASEAIIGYWNSLTKYPGLFADYRGRRPSTTASRPTSW